MSCQLFWPSWLVEPVRSSAAHSASCSARCCRRFAGTAPLPAPEVQGEQVAVTTSSNNILVEPLLQYHAQSSGAIAAVLFVAQRRLYPPAACSRFGTPAIDTGGHARPHTFTTNNTLSGDLVSGPWQHQALYYTATGPLRLCLPTPHAACWHP
ncbi:hypothetical protein COO60DRAFT_23138 [Scenedesmus sp. NREL 46B-D3]|nr:hypothetical protein COO60DRAFT_23138 [Scenedesmus sp. NREL 46B-D3]